MTTNLNIRVDKDVKNQAEALFCDLGLNMTAAVNVFLKASIREHGIPFELKADIPNKETLEAIEEGERMLHDPSTPKYTSIEDLKRALDV